jgi:hypothetical protein
MARADLKAKTPRTRRCEHFGSGRSVLRRRRRAKSWRDAPIPKKQFLANYCWQDSGESRVDQGISKQGNRRVRSLLIEMAWFWLRYQPRSAIAKWYAQRTTGRGQSKRGKRSAIVAVARRLAIALWRYLEHGVVPEGAVLKKG